MQISARIPMVIEVEYMPKEHIDAKEQRIFKSAFGE
jgi:hypothetical protein